MLFRVLLFPFRAVWFVLKLVLLPWYLRWLFVLPWWVMGIIALVIARIAVQEAMDTAQGRSALEDAMAQGPPPVVGLAAFDPLRDGAAQGEVRLLGTFRPNVTVQEREKPGPDMAFMPMFIGDTKEVGAVLVTLKLKANMLEALVAQAGEDGRMIVPGAISQMRSDRKAIVLSLRGVGFRVADDVPLIAPFLEGREKGLEAAVGYHPFFVVLCAVVALLFALLAVFRFVRWRQRKAAGVPVSDPAPLPARIPRPAAPVRPTTAVNGPWGQAKEGPVKRAPPAARPAEAAEPERLLPPPKPKSPPRPFVPRSPKALVDEAFGRKPGSGPKDP